MRVLTIKPWITLCSGLKRIGIPILVIFPAIEVGPDG